MIKYSPGMALNKEQTRDLYRQERSQLNAALSCPEDRRKGKVWNIGAFSDVFVAWNDGELCRIANG